jgi:hypothetical protein
MYQLWYIEPFLVMNGIANINAISAARPVKVIILLINNDVSVSDIIKVCDFSCIYICTSGPEMVDSLQRLLSVCLSL